MMPDPEAIPATDHSINTPLNTILYGPPGTGKTFNTINKALEILDPAFLTQHQNRSAIKSRFDEFAKSGDVQFVTFHQSYSYEDFIEGIRAESDEETGKLRYPIKDGVFKTLCNIAAPRVTQQSDISIDIADRRIWKMSLGNTRGSDAYIFDERITNNYALLGWGGAIDFSGCKDRDDVFERFTAAGHTTDKDSYEVTAVTIFLLEVKKGDLLVVSDGNTKFRAIGEIVGEYKHLIRDDEEHKYGQCRPVKWLRVYQPSLPAEQLLSTQFSQRTLYRLSSPSIDLNKLTGLLEVKTAGGVASIAKDALAFRVGENFNTGYEVAYVSSDLLELIKPNGKRLPIGMSILRTLAEYVQQGRLTLDDIKQKAVFSRVPETSLEPYIVNGYENILASLVERFLTSGATDITIKGSAHPKVLIIDGINRGNVSRIFGELITLIEDSKRLGAAEELKLLLPYSKELFGVPKDLYIVGTMNTADRSLTGLDLALRRRFTFIEMPPRPEDLQEIEISGLNLSKLLSIMNDRLETLVDRDHRIGHTYFLPLKDDPSLDRLAAIFRHQIFPLLQEYFFEDWSKIQLVLNDHQKVPENRFVTQAKNDVVSLFGDEGLVSEKNARWEVNDDAFSRIEAFLGIIDPKLSPSKVMVAREATSGDLTIMQLASGTIEVWKNGTQCNPTKQPLLELAKKFGLPTVYPSGVLLNTRDLGKRVLNALETEKT